MSLDAKVVLLGAQGVGKTSFVLRFVRRTFKNGNASTIGASFLAKKVLLDDYLVRLQIWDTAGQERFRSMAPMYYRSASCGILCYDITSEESFRVMHSWLLELKENLDSDVIIHIVGTKLDLVNADPSKRQVPFETCVAYASKYLSTVGGDGTDGAEACHEISSKDDQGVEEVFEAIIRRLIRRRLEVKHPQNDNPKQTIYIHNEEPETSNGCC